MNRSWRVAKLANIDVSVHWTFLLLVGWIGFTAFRGGGMLAAATEVAFVLSLFACVLLHEFGHAAAAAIFGIPTHGITLLPIGGVAQLDRIPRKPWQELVIALAGPAVNVLIVGIALPILVVSQSLWPEAVGQGGLLQRLVWTNVSLVVFNLLPAFPMDGGRVVRAMLATRVNYVTATRIAMYLGRVVALGFVAVGLFWNPLLVLLAMFVAFAADSEYQQVVAENRFHEMGQKQQNRTMAPKGTSIPPQLHALLLQNGRRFEPQLFYVRATTRGPTPI